MVIFQSDKGQWKVTSICGSRARADVHQGRSIEAGARTGEVWSAQAMEEATSSGLQLRRDTDREHTTLLPLPLGI